MSSSSIATADGCACGARAASRRQARGKRRNADRGHGRIQNLSRGSSIHPPCNSGLGTRCRIDLIPNRIRRKAEPARREPARTAWEAWHAIRAAHDRVAVILGIVPDCRGTDSRAGAQSYPTRAITIIVPYPAGGPTDTLTRVLAERMKTRARPIGDRRERHRRGRQHRHRPRRARGARRLHARHRPQPDPRHQCRDAEPALRRGEGFRAGVADRRHAASGSSPKKTCRRTTSRS